MYLRLDKISNDESFLVTIPMKCIIGLSLILCWLGSHDILVEIAHNIWIKQMINYRLIMILITKGLGRRWFSPISITINISWYINIKHVVGSTWENKIVCRQSLLAQKLGVWSLIWLIRAIRMFYINWTHSYKILS